MSTQLDQTTYAGEIVIVACWCGIRHGIPAELRRSQLREHNAGRLMSVYCPLGHTYAPAGKSEAERLRERLESANESERWYRNQLRAEQRSKAAIKGHLTRMRNRVARGVCPKAGCRRSFASLAEHVHDCHPELLGVLDDEAQ